MDFERHRKPMREISLVPLINVVFLLLIFFLVAGTVEKFDVVPVELPEAISGQVLDEGHIQIVLGKRSEVLINDELITIDEIQEQLAKQLEFNKKRIITVKADANMDAGRLITVMNKIKQAGGENLSLVTQEAL